MIVDRIYIGHIGDGNSLALTGIGLTFPIITLIMAFTALFGMGGVPLFAMARIVGWCAHRIEEVYNNNRIIRPAYKVIAEKREFTPLDVR